MVDQVKGIGKKTFRSRRRGLMNIPLKNEKSQQILPKSRNLAPPTIGS